LTNTFKNLILFYLNFPPQLENASLPQVFFKDPKKIVRSQVADGILRGEITISLG
jgi:hypothetical protein